MTRHDLLFVAACLAAGAHVAYAAVEGRKPNVPAQQSLVEDTNAQEHDDQRLASLLARLPEGVEQDLPDLVMVVLLGARADHLQRLPDTVSMLPNARRFEAARSTAGAPMPALGTLATGLQPALHGAVHARDGHPRRMGQGAPTLAERLAAAGYRTASVSGASSLGQMRLDRGFGLSLKQLRPGKERLTYGQGDRVTRLALAYAAQRPAGPMFLQVVYSDAELPWILREDTCTDDLFQEQVDDVDGALLPPGGMRVKQPGWAQRLDELLAGERLAEDDELLAWTTAYSSELCFLDGQVTRLLTGLKQHGVDEQDLVVVVGANGQQLGHRGLLGSGRSLFEEDLRVPLLVQGPGFERGTHSEPFTLAALPDALLAALGQPPLAPDLAERVLISERHGPQPRDTRPALRGRFSYGEQAWVVGDRKLVLSSGGGHSAFDLSEDPQELGAGPEPAWSGEMLKESMEWLTAQRAKGGVW